MKKRKLFKTKAIDINCHCCGLSFNHKNHACIFDEKQGVCVKHNSNMHFNSYEIYSLLLKARR